METHSSPLCGIWVNPRKTIQEIIAKKPIKNIPLLIVLATIVIALKSNNLVYIFSSILTSTIFVVLLTIVSILAIFITYLIAEIIQWSGKKLGGQARQEELRAVIAWSNIPVIWSILAWLIPFMLTPNNLDPALIQRINHIFYWIDFAFGAWASVIFIICLSEVQKFPIWKSFLNSLLSSLIIIGPILFIWGVIFLANYLKPS